MVFVICYDNILRDDEMGFQDDRLLDNMMPHFNHVVERICTPHWEIKREIYKYHNFILIYDGEAVFGCNGKEYRGTSGDLIYFKPGDVRWAYTFPDNLMKCFAIDFVYSCPILQDAQWQLVNIPLPFRTHQNIHDRYLHSRLLGLFSDCTKAWLSGTPNKIIRCRASFMEIISLLLMWKKGDGIHYDKIRKVETVIHYMAEYYPEPIHLEQLADILQISSSYLGSIFKEVTGKSPIDYLINIRINKAKELLRDGYMVTETAQKVGFGDVFYFSKCFKKQVGMSPTDYKKL